MTTPPPQFTRPVILRADQAETVGRPPIEVALLADSSATGGALSTIRVSLGEGSDGAQPHFHAHSAEMFYLLHGMAQLLCDDDVITAEAGDLVVVPPATAHAFAASPGQSARLLVIIAPGVERFEYFRHLERIAYGQADRASLLEVQDLYDTHFLTSQAWTDARAPRR